MRFTMLSAAALLAAALMFHFPEPLYGQSKEFTAITGLSRDVAALERRITELKDAQDNKGGELQTLVKQLMDANAKLSGEMRAMQEKILAGQAEQQKGFTRSLADMKSGIEELRGSITGLQALQTKMGTQTEATRTKVEVDVMGALTLILNKLDNLKPPEPVSLSLTPDQSAQLAFSKAQSDRLSNKLEFAIAGFIELANSYPSSPYAPMAWYEVGTMYADNLEYDQALDPFDRVIERFGDNPMRGPARMRKADALEKLGRKDDAIREYGIVVTEGPQALADTAQDKIKELKTPAPAASKNKAKTPAKSTKKGK